MEREKKELKIVCAEVICRHGLRSPGSSLRTLFPNRKLLFQCNYLFERNASSSSYAISFLLPALSSSSFVDPNTNLNIELPKPAYTMDNMRNVQTTITISTKSMPTPAQKHRWRFLRRFEDLKRKDAPESNECPIMGLTVEGASQLHSIGARYRTRYCLHSSPLSAVPESSRISPNQNQTIDRSTDNIVNSIDNSDIDNNNNNNNNIDIN